MEATEKLTKLQALKQLAEEIKKDYALKSSVPTKVSDLTNDKNFQSNTEVAESISNAVSAAISSVYKPGGSKKFSDLSGLNVVANEGKVYNVTDNFTTDENFVEGSGKKHPAGTNVAVVNASDSDRADYKFDVLAGFVDLTDYAKTEDINSRLDNKVDKEDGKKLSTEDYTTDDKNKLAGIKDEANKTTVATEGSGIIEIDGESKKIVEIASDEEVTAMLSEVFEA